MNEKEKDYILESFSYISDEYIQDAAMYKKKKSNGWLKYLSIAASIVLIAGTYAILPKSGNKKAMSEETEMSTEVTVSDCEQLPQNSMSADTFTKGFQVTELDSVEVENEEMDSKDIQSGNENAISESECTATECINNSTNIYQGQVEKVQYYKAKGKKTLYFAIATVTISEVYQGTHTAGDVCTIFLSKNVCDNSRFNLQQMRNLEVGSKGIFMTEKSDETTGETYEDSFLCYADYAKDYIEDERTHMFVSNKKGVFYAYDVYDEILDRGCLTLDQIAEYIKSIIKK